MKITNQAPALVPLQRQSQRVADSDQSNFAQKGRAGSSDKLASSVQPLQTDLNGARSLTSSRNSAVDVYRTVEQLPGQGSLNKTPVNSTSESTPVSPSTLLGQTRPVSPAEQSAPTKSAVLGAAPEGDTQPQTNLNLIA